MSTDRVQDAPSATYDSADNRGPARILQFLKSHNTEYLSGRDLGDVLGISRVAVWKQISHIRRLGYVIESRQKIGYRLVSDCDVPYPWEIVNGLDTKLIGRRVCYYDTLGSTQDRAAIMGMDASNNGTVIIAATQTDSRGRAGKRWLSPRGGIWMSVILHPGFGAPDATLLPLGAGAAVAGAVEDVCGVPARLRWPNDITVSGKKLAGIITEAEMESDRIRKVCLGIGLNFDCDIKPIEQEFSGMPGFYGVTSISTSNPGHMARCGKIMLIRAILSRLDYMYGMLAAGRRHNIISEWTRKSSTIGRRIRTVEDGREITGVAASIAENGMLVVNTDYDGADAGGSGEGGSGGDGKDKTNRQIKLMAGSLEYLD